MGRLIVCSNCGKEFDENLEKCPSCGSTNPKGAERAYLSRLEDVREDMEELDEAPRAELERTIKKQGRLIKRVVLAVMAVTALLAVVVVLRSRLEERDYKAQYLWKQENYPKLNALYDAGEYKELVKLYYELLGDKNSVFYEWEHYDFLETYACCLSVEDYLEEEKMREPKESFFCLLFSAEWEMKGIILRKEEFTEEEYREMEPYIELSEADFGERWNMTGEDYDAFYEQLVQHGGRYINFEDCEKYIKKWMKENR